MIAGIIGDCAGNTGVEILPVRVVSESGVANLTMIGLGIRYAISRGADVINLSLNFEENDYVSYWIDRAVAAVINVVVAAGNSKRDISKIYLANVQGVIAVSGIDNDYELSGTSNYGANIAFCAPDSYVTSSAFPTMVRKGTSFGAPMVATALALAKLDKNHTEEDLPVICRKLKDAIPDVNNYGYGLMQLDKLTESETYTISYNANGGTGAPPSQVKTRGVDLVLSTTQPVRTCTVTLDFGTGITDERIVKATFSGWKAEGTGTNYSPGSTYTEDAVDTLYAQWTFGTLGALPSPSRDGYSFDRWYTAKTGGNAVTESTKITKDMTIYAKWKPDFGIDRDLQNTYWAKSQFATIDTYGEGLTYKWYINGEYYSAGSTRDRSSPGKYYNLLNLSILESDYTLFCRVSKGEQYIDSSEVVVHVGDNLAISIDDIIVDMRSYDGINGMIAVGDRGNIRVRVKPAGVTSDVKYTTSDKNILDLDGSTPFIKTWPGGDIVEMTNAFNARQIGTVTITVEIDGISDAIELTIDIESLIILMGVILKMDLPMSWHMECFLMHVILQIRLYSWKV